MIRILFTRNGRVAEGKVMHPSWLIISLSYPNTKSAASDPCHGLSLIRNNLNYSSNSSWIEIRVINQRGDTTSWHDWANHERRTSSIKLNNPYHPSPLPSNVSLFLIYESFLLLLWKDWRLVGKVTCPFHFFFMKLKARRFQSGGKFFYSFFELSS